MTGLVLVVRNIAIVISPMRNPHDVTHTDGLTGPVVAGVDVETDLLASPIAKRL